MHLQSGVCVCRREKTICVGEGSGSHYMHDANGKQRVGTSVFSSAFARKMSYCVGVFLKSSFKKIKVAEKETKQREQSKIMTKETEGCNFTSHMLPCRG